jgi:hypothetical protein
VPRVAARNGCCLCPLLPRAPPAAGNMRHCQPTAPPAAQRGEHSAAAVLTAEPPPAPPCRPSCCCPTRTSPWGSTAPSWYTPSWLRRTSSAATRWSPPPSPCAPAASASPSRRGGSRPAPRCWRCCCRWAPGACWLLAARRLGLRSQRRARCPARAWPCACGTPAHPCATGLGRCWPCTAAAQPLLPACPGPAALTALHISACPSRGSCMRLCLSLPPTPPPRPACARLHQTWLLAPMSRADSRGLPPARHLLQAAAAQDALPDRWKPHVSAPGRQHLWQMDSDGPDASCARDLLLSSHPRHLLVGRCRRALNAATRGGRRPAAAPAAAPLPSPWIGHPHPRHEPVPGSVSLACPVMACAESIWQRPAALTAAREQPLSSVMAACRWAVICSSASIRCCR